LEAKETHKVHWVNLTTLLKKKAALSSFLVHLKRESQEVFHVHIKNEKLGSTGEN
jgi:L-rhamnose mutarotase